MASDSDSDQAMLAFRPARQASTAAGELKMKMPPRRMGASFGPNNELVVFGGSLNHFAQSANLVSQVSRQASRPARALLLKRQTRSRR